MTDTLPRLPKLRLFVAADIGDGAVVTLSREQTHYLANVMRAAPGDAVALFNGRDGEWTARIDALAKRGAELTVAQRTRAQATEPDLWLAFAPIKRGRIDWVAEKATELGVARLMPVMTARTQMSRVNVERLAANAIEAAEQCERMTVPPVDPPVRFDALLAAWPRHRILYVGDETGQGRPLAELLQGAAAGGSAANGAAVPRGVLVGPEGGFAPDELDALDVLPFVRKISLGPRVMRADTAAIAALAVIQALAGDWRAARR
ncbi:MAG: 16S rRNA (uracil(1498)-N(3))-methyltransferase [Alphaproteobacteria bacterium]